MKAAILAPPAQRGFTPVWRSAEHGFTLVEMMVALFLFGLLSAAGVALLGFSVRAQGAAGERLDKLAALRRIDALLTADLAQAAPRLGRDGEGALLPAFTGGDGSTPQTGFSFVRRGWDNPDGARRASLQRVRYALVDGRVERSAWPMLDGASPGAGATVVAGVTAMRVRYRGGRIEGADWRDRWDPARPAAIPRAVEVTLDIAGVGEVRELFLAGVGD